MPLNVTYYVVLLNGIPMDVTTIPAKAVQSQKELSVPGKDATIVPCIPLEWKQLEMDFMDEEPTEPNQCLCTYEVGSGGPTCTCKYGPTL